MNRLILIVVIVLLVGVGGYFLFSGGEGKSPQESSAQTPSLGVPAPGYESVSEMIVLPDGTGETEEGMEEKLIQSKIKEFNIRAFRWAFEPSTITVNKGDTVKLNITSEDVMHGFNLSTFGVSENLVPGKIITIEFTADKTGTFFFACSVFCGAGHSDMSGVLIVK